MTESLPLSTIPLTASDLPSLADYPVLVVHFWAIWDGTEHKFAPILNTVQTEFESRITFRSADVDAEGLTDFLQECEVNNVPALVCLIGGQRVKTVVGYRSADALRLEFAALLGEVVIPTQNLQQTPPPMGFLGWLRSLLR